MMIEERRGKNHTEVLCTNLDSLRPVSIDVHIKRIMHRHCLVIITAQLRLWMSPYAA